MPAFKLKLNTAEYFVPSAVVGRFQNHTHTHTPPYIHIHIHVQLAGPVNARAWMLLLLLFCSCCWCCWLLRKCALNLRLKNAAFVAFLLLLGLSWACPLPFRQLSGSGNLDPGSLSHCRSSQLSVDKMKKTKRVGIYKRYDVCTYILQVPTVPVVSLKTQEEKIFYNYGHIIFTIGYIISRTLTKSL